ncbi:hypothetical protein [Paenibacillus alvei]|uniref:Glycosyl transferase family 8 n=1 Tax=Paenibacillus alvei TaxID=44250 RepID=A0A383R9K1_PAEAL|nr:hypothetical protein [Paenibacillus alvei]SYX83785.1 conserved protein of unknown function [Paenibacillus alvei]
MSQLLITCVAENTKEFHFRVLTLFHTIIHFGGELSSAKFVANFVERVDVDIQEQLEHMGVHVKIVKPYRAKLQRHCNKIRMLELDEDYEVLLALDCDTAVTRDFTSEIDAYRFRRCDSLLDPLRIDEWKYLYNFYSLPIPDDEKKIHANSAVLFIPKKHVTKLRDAWLDYAHRITDTFFTNEQRSVFGRHKYYTDQFALSLALADQQIESDLLPAEFHIHINGKYQSWADQLHPYILSYHHNVTTDWKLQTTGMAIPDQYIHKVNNSLTFQL